MTKNHDSIPTTDQSPSGLSLQMSPNSTRTEVKEANRLRLVLSSLADYTVETDDTGTIIWMNQRGLSFLGARAIGDRLYNFFQKHHRMQEQVQQVMQGTLDRCLVECWQTSVEGEERCLEWICTRLGDADGRNSGLICVGRDMTDARNAERALMESESRYRTIMENFHGILFRCDMNTTIVFVNGEVSDITGYTAEELVRDNITWRDLLHSDDVPLYLSKIEQASLRNGAKTLSMEHRLHHRNGSIRWVQQHARIVNEASDVPLCIDGVMYDITESRMLREHLLYSQRMEAIGTLASGIAHDFNNLLSGILGRAEMLKSRADKTDPAYMDADVIEAAADRAALLTRQLLDFGQSGEFNMVPVNVNRLINDVMAIIEHSIPKNISLVKNLDMARLMIQADSRQLKQVIVNLVINARDAMKSGGTLTVESGTIKANAIGTIAEGDHVCLRFRDTGIGIPPEIRGRIFEPFFTTKENGQGTGMGLATSYGIVKNHRGWIEVESEPSRGTVFSVYLPALPPVSTPAQDIGSRTFKGKGKVMVVDDEEMILSTLKAVLDRLGYEAILFRSGIDAIEHYRKYSHEIDLVLVDFIMPTLDGSTCIRYLRGIDPQVRVILMTGCSLQDVASTVDESEFLDVIQKPFKVNHLSKVLLNAFSTNKLETKK